MVSTLGNIQIVLSIEGQTLGPVELGIRGRSTVTREAGRPGPDHGRDDPLCVDTANDVIRRLGEIEAPGGIYC